MNRTIPTPTFATLRSSLDPIAVLVAEAESEADGTESILVRAALSEILATLDDLLSLGFPADRIEQVVEREIRENLSAVGRPLDAITTADRLVAVRGVARRVERFGVRLHGSKWRERVQDGVLLPR